MTFDSSNHANHTNHTAHTTRREVLRAATASAALIALGSHAQSAWPAKPVSLVVPFPAGGGTDAFARPLSAVFAKISGKALVIDNRGGRHGGRNHRIKSRA